MKPRLIAEIAYEANNIYRKSIGEAERESWDSLEFAEQNRLTMAVEENIKRGCEMSPEDCHLEWLAYKVTMGWVYGETENTLTKRHPDIVPWNKLPGNKRIKNSLFIGIIRALKDL